MKIIVVGNGSSNLTKVHGKVIDTYDKVIRINDYVLEGFESFVGTKTDIWAMDTNTFSHNVEYYDRFETINESWVLPSFTFRASRAEISERLSKLVSNSYVSSFAMINEIREEINGFPSTGLLTLMTAISKFSDAFPISITGFDHFSGEIIDYWDMEWKMEVPHSGKKERAYVENKIEQKKLRRI